MTTPTPLPDAWDDGDTLGAEDFNKVARRVNDIYTANADDYSQALVEITGAATLPAVPYTYYTVYLRAGAVPKLPTAINNTCRYTIKNTTTATIPVAFTGGQTADRGPLSIAADESVDLLADPVTPANPTATWRIV